EVDGAPPYVPASPQAFVDADSGSVAMRIVEDNDTIRALYKLSAYRDGYLYVARSVDKGVLESLRHFEQSLIAYREAEARRARLQGLFALSYLSTVLLVLLGAVWLGLSFATRISEPIG